MAGGTFENLTGNRMVITTGKQTENVQYLNVTYSDP
jgi:hypothetical protein